MEKQWVDFRAVKAAVSMSTVLDHYGINWLRKKGDELRGRCPIHKGEGTAPSTSVSARMPSTASHAKLAAMSLTWSPLWSRARCGMPR